MSEYRPGRRRRRSRGGRRGPGSRNNNNRTPRQKQPAKPQGFLGWLKSLFGITPETNDSSSDGDSRRRRDDGRSRSNSRGDRRSGDRSKRREHSDSPASSGETEAPVSAARRKAELLEVTTPRLYVGNLNYDISESDLFELFSQAAPVKNVEIARDRESEKSKGFGFIEFGSVEDAKAAQAKLNEYEFAGRPLLVSGAKAPNPRRSGGNRARREESESTENSAPEENTELAATPAGEISEEDDAKFNR